MVSIRAHLSFHLVLIDSSLVSPLLIVVAISGQPEFCECCAGRVRNEEDPDYNQDFKENSGEGKSYLLDHIEPMFSNNIHGQLKPNLLSHVLCITLLRKYLQ